MATPTVLSTGNITVRYFHSGQNFEISMSFFRVLLATLDLCFGLLFATIPLHALLNTSLSLGLPSAKKCSELPSVSIITPTLALPQAPACLHPQLFSASKFSPLRASYLAMLLSLGIDDGCYLYTFKIESPSAIVPLVKKRYNLAMLYPGKFYTFQSPNGIVG